MKQMKKLTRNQKIILSKETSRPECYGLIAENKGAGVFMVGLRDYPETRLCFKYTSSATGKRISEEEYEAMVN